MKVFYNSKIAKVSTPIHGFSTIMLLGMVFTEESTLSKRVLEHENAHIQQYEECTGVGLGIGIISFFTLALFAKVSMLLLPLLVIVLPALFYYLIYLLEWFLKLFKYGRKAYDNINFEKEAVLLQDNWDKYCNQRIKRKPFGWLNFKSSYKEHLI